MQFFSHKSLNENAWFFIKFTEVCFWKLNQQYSSIDLNNGLAQTRQQAIIWTNNG